MKLRLIAAVLAVLVSGGAEACDCPPLPPEQIARASTLFFMGETMIPREVVPKGGASFQNSLIWKGPRLGTPIVAGNQPDGDASCAAEFYLSETYYILAFGSHDTGYYTDKCLMTRMNTATSEQQDIIRAIVQYYVRLQAFLQEAGPIDMQNLVWLRKVAEFYLKNYSAEQALSYYRHASLVSRKSVIDLQGEGEAYLQLLMAREALTKFDDVLEKDNTRQNAWQGRYKALALMGRWSELPPDKPDLSSFIWRQAKLTADLRNPIFTRAWWMQIDASSRKLTGADFSNAELSAVSFTNTDLTGANFSGARLFAVDFTGANLKDANFTGVAHEQVKWPEGYMPPPSTTVAPSVGQQDPAGR